MSEDSTKGNGHTLAVVYARLDAFQANSEKRQAQLKIEITTQFQNMMDRLNTDMKEMMTDVKDCRERIIKIESRPSCVEFQSVYCANTRMVSNAKESLVKHKEWHDEEDRKMQDKIERQEEREAGDATKLKLAVMSAVVAVGLFLANIVMKLWPGGQ